MKSWFAVPLADIERDLKTDFTGGLTDKNAAERLHEYGRNELPRGKKLHWWQLFLRQFKSPLVIILVIAGVLTLILEEFMDMSIIFLSVTVNICIGFWQEFRSNRIFESLQAIIKVKALVKRGGKISETDAENLVPGDIIILKDGMKIPADARLFKATDLEVNESILTGESKAVKKITKDLKGELVVGDRSNMAHTGTTVEKGSGIAVVVATGTGTEIGQIADLTLGISDEETPLQQRLSKLGKIITIFVSISAAVIFAVGYVENHGFVEMFTVAVAVSVAAIPEGLPAALAAILAISSQRIFKKGGLVKKLIGAETLGSTSVICTDKTGTLTEGKMTVEQILETADEKRTELIMALANGAVARRRDTSWEVHGEETDQAKLEYFLAHGGDIEVALETMQRIAEIPFDSDLKYLASFHQDTVGDVWLFASGAPETLLNCSALTPDEKNTIHKKTEEKAKQGYRMIAVAEKKLGRLDSINTENTEFLRSCMKNLDFRGLAAIRDPIRPDVPASILTVKKAGIRVIMVTGDHKLTASSIARDLGFDMTDRSIMEGSEIDTMTDEGLKERIKNINVFSRVSPRHKMRIVDALQKNGYVVAMTGDGVNDAPALKAADIGIALESGTDVTKEAADLVLLNNSFSVITEAIKQGRVAFDNMRKVTIFLLMGSFTELIAITASLILRIPLPITAIQLLWANLVEDGFPNFALAFEPGEKDIMERKPIARRESILGDVGNAFVFLQGLVTDLILVGVFLWLYYAHELPLDHVRTVVFAALGIDALFLAFSVKNLHRSLFQTPLWNNRYLILATILGIGFMTLVIYMPAMNKIFDTVPLGIFEISLVAGLTLFEIIYAEIIKTWFIKKKLQT